MTDCGIIRDCSLKELNTWGSGGRCLWLAAPGDADKASLMIRAAMDAGEKLYVLGGGSNVLVQDGVIEAGVIASSSMDSLEYAKEGDLLTVYAGAGVQVKKLLALAVAMELDGLAFLAGIPGTLGGAISGNAGAAGESLAPLVERLETVTSSGEIVILEKNELKWRYRSAPWTSEPPVMVTKAVLRVPFGQKRNIIENIRHFSSLKKGQPLGAKTAGCVFKNPEGASAGRLLDLCSCKGLRVGGAVVSCRHANFIENIGNASSRDIYELAELCRKRVCDEFGTVLEYEIKFFGAF